MKPMLGFEATPRVRTQITYLTLPKVAGEVASPEDPALDRLLHFATEAGLVVLVYNDLDTSVS